jgi:ABC-type lipoprotein release transport system permease subunit
MSVTHLIWRELRYCWLTFALGVVAVAAATGCLVAVVVLLRAHDRRTEELVAAKQNQTQERMRRLEDDYRKINKEFNLLILHKDQDLSAYYTKGYADRDMPETYARKLADARVLTINHVLPLLQQRLFWPERKREIVLIGVRGEVYVQSKKQEPILHPVPKGSVVVGHELHQALGLDAGAKLTLLGRPFTISKVQEAHGNADDVTLWIDLQEAQDLLGKNGSINGILALECGCAPERLPKIRSEVASQLPQTQVVEFHTQATARAEARSRAAEEAKDAVESEKQGRARLREEREATAAMLAPVVLVVGVVWIGLLTLANVRDRALEVGVLRALGLRTGQVVWLFLGRALLLGLLGGLLGVAAGLAAALPFAEATHGGAGPLLSGVAVVLLAAPLAAMLLAALAAWLPIQVAVRRDPALALREG